MSLQPDWIAIDGGGTRCRLVAGIGAERVQVEVGSTNVSSNMAAAVSEIVSGLDALAVECGVQQATLLNVPVYAGLAGVTGPEIAEEVVGRLPFHFLHVEDDRPAAIRAALGQHDGALVHCGTGSFMAVQRDGVVRSAGGWGAVLGDHASAMWIGREALAAVLDVVDGLIEPSELTGRWLEYFGGPTGIVQFARSATATDFGALAPDVTKAAQDGDAVAEDVMRRGADGVTEVVCALGWVEGLPLKLTGGLAPHYVDYLEAPWRSVVTEPLGLPIDGAVSLAQEYARTVHG